MMSARVSALVSKLPDLYPSHPSFLRNHLFVWQKHKKIVEPRGPLLQGGGVSVGRGGSESQEDKTDINNWSNIVFLYHPYPSSQEEGTTGSNPTKRRRGQQPRGEPFFSVFSAVTAEFWLKTVMCLRAVRKVFVKPNDQSQACLSFGMARKR